MSSKSVDGRQEKLLATNEEGKKIERGNERVKLDCGDRCETEMIISNIEDMSMARHENDEYLIVL